MGIGLVVGPSPVVSLTYIYEIFSIDKISNLFQHLIDIPEYWFSCNQAHIFIEEESKRDNMKIQLLFNWIIKTLNE